MNLDTKLWMTDQLTVELIVDVQTIEYWFLVFFLPTLLEMIVQLSPYCRFDNTFDNWRLSWHNDKGSWVEIIQIHKATLNLYIKHMSKDSSSSLKIISTFNKDVTFQFWTIVMFLHFIWLKSLQLHIMK